MAGKIEFNYLLAVCGKRRASKVQQRCYEPFSVGGGSWGVANLSNYCH